MMIGVMVSKYRETMVTDHSFFFSSRRRHTRFDCDWSSDVCSSDLFLLRTEYSSAMKATFLDAAGTEKPFEMGCYGIGVTRVVAAAIEQNNDARGIVFPAPIAPFAACLVPIGYQKSAAVREAADRLHDALEQAGIDVLMDDRDERPGVLFADLDLIGLPHRVVLSERGLAAGNAEYKGRREEKPREMPLDSVGSFLKERLRA